eukprot:gene11219-biopygen3342
MRPRGGTVRVQSGWGDAVRIFGWGIGHRSGWGVLSWPTPPRAISPGYGSPAGMPFPFTCPPWCRAGRTEPVVRMHRSLPLFLRVEESLSTHHAVVFFRNEHALRVQYQV